MRRTFTIAAIAVLVLTGIVKLIAAPSRTAAIMSNTIQTAMPIYDLETRYPGMSALPVEDAPQP